MRWRARADGAGRAPRAGEGGVFVAHPANGCAIVHSDSPEGVQRLNQEAAKAMTRGARAGLPVAPEAAIAWVTANAAKALGIAQLTGTLEPGKMADVVVWSRDPFSVYALADQVFVDGALAFDRSAPPAAPRSDFLLGQPAREGTRRVPRDVCAGRVPLPPP